LPTSERIPHSFIRNPGHRWSADVLVAFTSPLLIAAVHENYTLS
jgi:hypothetical protein